MSKEINTVAIEEILQRHGVDYTGGLIEELRRLVQNSYNSGYNDAADDGILWTKDSVSWTEAI